MSIANTIAAERTESIAAANDYLWRALSARDIDPQRIVSECEAAEWELSDFDDMRARVESYRAAIDAAESAEADALRLAIARKELTDLELDHRAAVRAYEDSAATLEQEIFKLRANVDNSAKALRNSAAGVPGPPELTEELATLRRRASRARSDEFEAKQKAMILSRDVSQMETHYTNTVSYARDGAELDKLDQYKADLEATRRNQDELGKLAIALTQEADEKQEAYLKQFFTEDTE